MSESEITQELLYRLFILEKLTAPEIATKLNTSISTIKRNLKKYGIGRDKFYVSKSTLVDLYLKQNRTLSECGQILNVDRSTIMRWVKKYNLKKEDITFKVDKEQLYKCYIVDNKSKEECAKILNVSLRVIDNRLKEYDIHKSKEKINELLSQRTSQSWKNNKDFRNKVKNNHKFLNSWKLESPELAKEIYQNNGKKSIKNLKKWCEDNREQHSKDLKISAEKLNKWKIENSGEFSHILKSVGNGERLKQWVSENPERFRENYIKNFKLCREYQTKSLKNLSDLNETFVRNTFIVNNRFEHTKFLEYFNFVSMSSVSQYKKLWNIIEPNDIKRSNQQLEINEYITGLDIPTLYNNRNILNPYELDIYIPEKKLAIEFDGLLFHSFGESKYSVFNNAIMESEFNPILKLDLCQEKGIHLLTIWENEWNNKQDIWKSVISSHLGKNNRVFARKCEIKSVVFSTTKDFLEADHLQGSIPSSINLGLYYNNELVSLMTFGKSRFNKNYEYELLRYCNKKYTNVIGGASRLLKYFVRTYNPKSIISYANKRWSNGNLYKQLGFEYVGDSKPTYYYFYKNQVKTVYSRLKFQKHKLPDILEDFNPELSERENMYNNGYRRIYDCGQLVFEWKNS